MWTIYDHPEEFPHCYVARRFEVCGAEVHETNQVIVAHKLTAVREHLIRYHDPLTRIVPRTAGDDPKVIETWM
jgi:hypothetical protein